MKCGYCKTVGHKIGACNAGEHLLKVNSSNYGSLTARELKWLVSHKKGKTSGKNKPELLEMLNKSECTICMESECPICMESVTCFEKTVCGHSFCKPCISKHLENDHRCPMCRTALKAPVEDSNDIVYRIERANEIIELRRIISVYMNNPNTLRDEIVIRLLGEFYVNPSNDLLVEIINRFGMIEIERLRNITITI